jgi:hypothetical protein
MPRTYRKGDFLTGQVHAADRVMPVRKGATYAHTRKASLPGSLDVQPIAPPKRKKAATQDARRSS